jgi:hypothetical protein
MERSDTVQKLLAHRKLTRAVGEVIRGRLNDYMEILTPIFSPRSVLGNHVQGTGKEPAKGADQAFKELQDLYNKVAPVGPFNLLKELTSPLLQMTSSLELTSVEYSHAAKTDRESKMITVTCPFKSILTYAGYALQRLKAVIANRDRNDDELQQFVLHYLAMHIVLQRKPKLKQILDTLHFPVESSRLPAFGDLPITYIGSYISTSLPAEELVIESTELSGKDAFEELVNVNDIDNLHDPLKEQLQALVRSHA